MISARSIAASALRAGPEGYPLTTWHQLDAGAAAAALGMITLQQHPHGTRAHITEAGRGLLVGPVLDTEAVTLLRRLDAAAGFGTGWRIITDAEDGSALVLTRAGLAIQTPSLAWCHITERGTAALRTLDALTLPPVDRDEERPAPAPRVPLDVEALDDLTDDAIARVLDDPGTTLDELLPLVRHLALDIARREAPETQWAASGAQTEDYASRGVYADAYAVSGATRRTVASSKGATDRDAAVGLARKLLARRQGP